MKTKFLISRCYKSIIKPNNPVFKMGKESEQFIKKKMQMVFKRNEKMFKLNPIIKNNYIKRNSGEN